MHLDFLNDLLFQYGLYAVFILVMVEGDITLLLAGVLAHSAFFGPYSFAQVLIWGTIGGGFSDKIAGYFFSGAVMGLIGDFQRLGKVLLVIVLLGIVAFYLIERYWLSPKMEEANPERLHELEHAASEKLQDLKEELQEHIPFKHPRRTDQKKPESDAD